MGLLSTIRKAVSALFNNTGYNHDVMIINPPPEKPTDAEIAYGSKLNDVKLYNALKNIDPPDLLFAEKIDYTKIVRTIKRAKKAKDKRRKKLTAAHRAKISATLTGKKHSAETRAKMSANQTGKPGRIPSAETRAKMSKAHTGKTKTDKQKRKEAKTHWAKGPNAAAIRLKMAAVQKKRWEDPVMREKASQTQKNRFKKQPVNLTAIFEGDEK